MQFVQKSQNVKLSKNVKRYIKKQSKYNEFLKFTDFPNPDIYKKDGLAIKENIVLKNYIFLLDLNKIPRDIHHKEIQLINLCTSYITKFLKSQPNKIEINIKKTLSVIEDLTKQWTEIVHNFNFEKEIIEEAQVKFEHIEYEALYNIHSIYRFIGDIFFKTFYKSFDYYQYGYTLSFFLVSHLISLRTTNLTQNTFLIEVLANKKYIESIKQINGEYYNLFIIKNNKFLKHVNDMYAKLEMEDQENV